MLNFSLYNLKYYSLFEHILLKFSLDKILLILLEKNACIKQTFFSPSIYSLRTPEYQTSSKPEPDMYTSSESGNDST